MRESRGTVQASDEAVIGHVKVILRGLVERLRGRRQVGAETEAGEESES